MQTHLRFDGPLVRAMRCGRTWRMLALDRDGKPLHGTWFLAPSRSTLSTSGVTGRLQFPIAEPIAPGEPIDWRIHIELVPEQQ